MPRRKKSSGYNAVGKDFTIKNRRRQNIVITFEEVPNAHGLAFVMHGFAGFRKQKHVRTFVDVFLAQGLSVVSFDTTNSNGDSDGGTRDATMDTYVHDLEDVVLWAKTQSWFKTPFALCGHSMGAQSVAWYASKHPEEVSLLLPLAPMVNYDLRIKIVPKQQKDILKEKGYVELPSASKPGVVNVFTRANHESLQKYDLLPVASNITMPVLNIVGEKDEPCPVQHQQLFMEAAKSNDKTLEIIPGVDHNYRADDKNYDDTLAMLSENIQDWLSQRS